MNRFSYQFFTPVLLFSVIVFNVELSSAKLKVNPPRRKISSLESIEVKAIAVFKKFTACGSKKYKTRKSFLNCTKKYLEPTLDRDLKSVMSAWLLMDYEIYGPYPCDDSDQKRAELHPKYRGLTLCFEIKTPSEPDIMQKGFVFYTLTRKTKPLIYSIKY